MLNELGHYALVLALAVSIVQSAVPGWGARVRDDRLMAVGQPAALTGFVLVAIAFFALTVAYVRSDFSLLNVWQNSHSDKPLVYKISGVWGNHEGSLLLWVLILTLFGMLVALMGRNMPSSLRATVISVQGWITVAFLLFILLTSNPFIRISPAPLEGQDLNPLLQDIGLAIHPPLLYLGYVGFSVTFAFAVAALIEGRIDAAWARWVRPWVLIAWIFLTLGISMGSYWAYYELGWGGWWFWDPVENASFMPWLAGTALLHSAIVMEKRDALRVWTILLAIVRFSLSLIGTFLGRSGVLTSVHAFATDPTRGLFILLILCVFIGGALSLFAWRASLLKAGGAFSPISREGGLVLNNLILTTSCLTVLVGTLYPLALEAVTGEKISVGAPFFNMTFIPLVIPLLLAMPAGPLLAWKRGDLGPVMERLSVAAVAAVAAIAIAWWLMGLETGVAAVLSIGLAFWIIVGSLLELWARVEGGATMAARWQRLTRLPRSTWGAALGHLGIGLTVLGISATAFQQERIVAMQPGDTVEIAGYTLSFRTAEQRRGPNYDDAVGVFDILRGGEVVAVAEPARRLYPARQMPTTEASIATFGLSQVYTSLGDRTEDGRIVVRVYHKPLVLLIWIGTIVMSVGGALSLSDRRLRVGTPAPVRKREERARPAGEAGLA